MTRRSLFASAVALLALPRRVAAERMLVKPRPAVGTPERLFELFIERAHADGRPTVSVNGRGAAGRIIITEYT